LAAAAGAGDVDVKEKGFAWWLLPLILLGLLLLLLLLACLLCMARGKKN
jgi:hypothetical protein